VSGPTEQNLGGQLLPEQVVSYYRNGRSVVTEYATHSSKKSLLKY
jgi:hypothetical protein